MRKFSKIMIVLLLFWMSSESLWAQGGVVLDKIVAKVDNYIILRSDVDQLYFNLLYQNQLDGMNEETARCRIMEQMVVEKMMLAKAEIDSIVVEERQVESQLERRMQIMTTQIGGPEKIEEIYGKTVDDLKDELRGDIRNQLTVQRMQSEITQSVDDPTPKEVRKFFNSIPVDSLPFFNSEVEVSHIVKIPGVNRKQKQEVKDRLIKIKERIEKGEDFGELAKIYSEDPGSGSKGGDLNWLSRGSSVPEFEAAVFRLKKGELSKIVESEYGFHLIKLIDRRGNEYRAAHILLRPNYDLVDVSYAENFLDSLRTDILNDSISFEKAAREYSDDEGNATSGGAIAGPSGETRISLDDLDSYLYFAIDTMKVGQISKPIPYRTDDGKSAVRIIYFKSKTKAHAASLEEDYQKFYNFTLSQKRNQAVNDWFTRTKDEVYISIDEEFNHCNILKIQ